MKIIELNGLPGCGKTTLIRNVIKHLEKRNLAIGTLQDVVFRTRIFNYNSYFQLGISLFSLKELKFNVAVLRFTMDYKLNKMTIMYAMRLIKLNRQLNAIKQESHYDVLLLEEGVIQYVTSIPHDELIIGNNNFNKLCKAIQKKFGKHIHINCNIENSENVLRLKKRNKKNNRFDSLPPNKLEKSIHIRRENILLLRKMVCCFNSWDMDMEQDLCTNTKTILALFDELSGISSLRKGVER